MMIPEIAFTLDRNNRCLACEDKDERIAVLTHALELACKDNANYTQAWTEQAFGYNKTFTTLQRLTVDKLTKDYYIQQAETERGDA